MKKTIEIPEGYEAALERCKQWVAGTSGLNPGASPKEVAEYLFPELAESEDEKIRKDIIAFLQSMNSHCNPTQDWDLRNRWLPYLERQKEKPICLSAGARKRLIETIYSDIEECIKGAEKRLSYFPFLKSQKEQKPVQDREEREYVRTLKSLIVDFLRGKDEVDRGYYQKIYDWLDGRHIEQMQVEDKDAIEPTPKQDYSGLTDFERAIHRGFLCAGVENVPVDIIKDTAQDCLAQIKPAEWGEEDERMRQDVIQFIETGWTDNGKSHLIPWLKSLRPQPKKQVPIVKVWKPSEEQIDDLQMLLDDLNNLDNKNNVKMIKVFHWSENYKNLKGLLDNLKKL